MLTAIKFAKVKENAVIPTKRDEDAGLDIYACFDEDFITIAPHETKIIPAGIASACDTDYCFVLKERSSTGTKGIAQRCGILDSGYRGEWGIPVTNTNNIPIIIAKESADLKTTSHQIVYPYEKAICQALVVPVPILDIEEYTYDELMGIGSERGTGGYGSSGK